MMKKDKLIKEITIDYDEIQYFIKKLGFECLSYDDLVELNTYLSKIWLLFKHQDEKRID